MLLPWTWSSLPGIDKAFPQVAMYLVFWLANLPQGDTLPASDLLACFWRSLTLGSWHCTGLGGLEPNDLAYRR